LGPFGTSATEWPIVPAPGDYDYGGFGGMKIDVNDLCHIYKLRRKGHIKLQKILIEYYITDKFMVHYNLRKSSVCLLY
jgi:hypothetical protein